jgi:hypothetical protein
MWSDAGVCVTGHFFYGFLDGKIPGTDALSVASKVRRPCQAKLKMLNVITPSEALGATSQTVFDLEPSLKPEFSRY